MIIREAKKPIKYEHLHKRVSHVKAYVKATAFQKVSIEMAIPNGWQKRYSYFV